MHLPDGVLSHEMCAVTGLAASAAVGYSLYRLRASVARPSASLTAAVAALVFAGQMINFPLFVAPVSGHLLGGVLAGVLLGPYAGCLAIACVLLVQAAVFADGGLASLGANVLNMGVVGVWGGSSLVRLFRGRLTTVPGGSLASVALAAWVSVVLAALVCGLEIGASTAPAGAPFASVMASLLGTHALIGIGEAAVTVLLVALMTRSADGAVRAAPAGRLTMTGLIAALAIAGLLSPWASGHPDGLEAVAERAGWLEHAYTTPLILADYAIAVIPGAVGDAFATSLAGLVGTAAVLLLAWVLARLVTPTAKPLEAA